MKKGSYLAGYGIAFMLYAMSSLIGGRMIGFSSVIFARENYILFSVLFFFLGASMIYLNLRKL